jgi:hypothetical protein
MRVFLSHAAVDRPFAERLRSALEKKGINVLSATDIRAGDDFSKAITDAITTANAVIPIISRASAENPNVAAEVALAIANRIEGNRKPIIPVLADPLAESPFFLRNLQWVDLSNDRKFDEHFDKLVDGLSIEAKEGPTELWSFKSRNDWLNAQRTVLVAESAALDAARRRQFRYVILALMWASIVAGGAVISFLGLHKSNATTNHVSFASGVVPFVAGVLCGMATVYFSVGVFKKWRRGDE